MKRALTCFIALLMSLVIATAFVGCSEAEENNFEGKWVAQVNLTELITDNYDETILFFGYFEINDFVVDISFEFKSDGTYTAVCDRDLANISLENVKKDLEANMQNMLLASAEQMGLDMTLDEILISQNTTMDELVSQFIDEGAINKVYEFLEQGGVFEAKSGKLYRFVDLNGNLNKEVYETYETVDDGKIKITAIVGGESLLEQANFADIIYPLTLERK